MCSCMLESRITSVICQTDKTRLVASCSSTTTHRFATSSPGKMNPQPLQKSLQPLPLTPIQQSPACAAHTRYPAAGCSIMRLWSACSARLPVVQQCETPLHMQAVLNVVVHRTAHCRTHTTRRRVPLVRDTIRRHNKQGCQLYSGDAVSPKRDTHAVHSTHAVRV
jgi:hypothetical protein